jgi:heat shock protein HslJ
VRRLVLALLVILLLGGTGCGPGEQPPLANTTWKLTGWAEPSPPPANLTMTAQFGAGTLNGSAGINNYNGTFVSEVDGSLAVRLGAMTLMGGPEADMKAESAYIGRLGAARGYRITGSTLVLTDADRKDSLTFARA